MSVTISIADEATPLMRRLAMELNGGVRMNKAIANAALPVYQRHFRSLSSSNKNKFGVRSSFWNRMVSGTKPVATADAAIIRMPREVALRYFGGTVTPKKAKFLAIPANAQAYGKSPRDFSDLRFAVLGKAGPALVQNEQTGVKFRKSKGGVKLIRGAEKGGGVFFWLRRSATIGANADVLPNDEDVIGAVNSSLNTYLAFIGRQR